jgi:hypothetical protein
MCFETAQKLKLDGGSQFHPTTPRGYPHLAQNQLSQSDSAHQSNPMEHIVHLHMLAPLASKAFFKSKNMSENWTLPQSLPKLPNTISYHHLPQQFANDASKWSNGNR